MKKIVALCLWAVMAFGPLRAVEERNLLQGAVSREQLRRVLVSDGGWVGWPAYADRAGWERVFGARAAEIVARGERLLDYRWQVVRATDYMAFERTGDRTVMERPLDENIEAVVQLLLAELAEGRGRFTDQLVNGVYHTCEMTSWALSAHLIQQPTRRALPSSRCHVVDLVAGDVGATLSWVHHFMHEEFDRIDPEIARRLREELERRIMKPYMEGEFWWMALTDYRGGMVNNWNPWCNSNVLMTFMLMERDAERLADAVWRTMRSVDRFLNYVHADGACEEGPSYWGHAAGKALDYLVLLERITGGRVNIFDRPQIRAMGEYISRSYAGDGWVVNFADASARGSGDPWLVYRYGRAVGSDELEGFAALLARTEPWSWSGRDLFRILESLGADEQLRNAQAVRTEEPLTWYPETQFCYLRRGRAFFAAKGGHNGESHNHNDVGTFSLWLDRTPVFVDAGVGTYTRQTFGSERYSIWTMRSDYHNLPLVNGLPQHAGSRYRASHVEASADGLSVDIAAAYPDRAGVKRWTRAYRLKERELTVTDSFELSKAEAPNTVHFMTWGDVRAVPDRGRVEIEVRGVRTALRYDKNRFDVRVEPVELTDPRLSRVWGPRLYRIGFEDRRPERRGTYRFVIEL